MMSFFLKFIKTVLYIYSQISLKGHLANIDGLPIRRTFLEDGRIAHIIKFIVLRIYIVALLCPS